MRTDDEGEREESPLHDGVAASLLGLVVNPHASAVLAWQRSPLTVFRIKGWETPFGDDDGLSAKFVSLAQMFLNAQNDASFKVNAWVKVDGNDVAIFACHFPSRFRSVPSEPATQVQMVGIVFSDGLGGDAEVSFSGFTNKSHQRFLTSFVQWLRWRLRCQQVVKSGEVRPEVGVECFDVVSVELP